MLHHLGIFNYTSPRPNSFFWGIFGRDVFFPNHVFWGDQPRPTLVAEKNAEIHSTHQLSKWKFQSTRWILTQTLDNKSYSKNPMETKYHFLCGQNVWWLIVWFQMLVRWWFTMVESYKQIQDSCPSSISDLWHPFKGAFHPPKSHHLPRGLPALKGSSLPVPKVSKTPNVFERWWLNRPVWKIFVNMDDFPK